MVNRHSHGSSPEGTGQEEEKVREASELVDDSKAADARADGSTSGPVIPEQAADARANGSTSGPVTSEQAQVVGNGEEVAISVAAISTDGTIPQTTDQVGNSDQAIATVGTTTAHTEADDIHTGPTALAAANAGTVKEAEGGEARTEGNGGEAEPKGEAEPDNDSDGQPVQRRRGCMPRLAPRRSRPSSAVAAPTATPAGDSNVSSSQSVTQDSAAAPSGIKRLKAAFGVTQDPKAVPKADPQKKPQEPAVAEAPAHNEKDTKCQPEIAQVGLPLIGKGSASVPLSAASTSAQEDVDPNLLAAGEARAEDDQGEAGPKRGSAHNDDSKIAQQRETVEGPVTNTDTGGHASPGDTERVGDLVPDTGAGLQSSVGDSVRVAQTTTSADTDPQHETVGVAFAKSDTGDNGSVVAAGQQSETVDRQIDENSKSQSQLVNTECAASSSEKVLTIRRPSRWLCCLSCGARSVPSPREMDESAVAIGTDPGVDSDCESTTKASHLEKLAPSQDEPSLPGRVPPAEVTEELLKKLDDLRNRHAALEAQVVSEEGRRRHEELEAQKQREIDLEKLHQRDADLEVIKRRNLELQHALSIGGPIVSPIGLTDPQDLRSALGFCPDGHALRAYVVSSEVWCDVCSSAIPQAAEAMSCRECNFDMCSACRQSAALRVPAGVCPAGHQLQMCTLPKQGACDSCGRSIPGGVQTMGCQQCDYDLCAECCPRRAEQPRPKQPDVLGLLFIRHDAGCVGGLGRAALRACAEEVLGEQLCGGVSTEELLRRALTRCRPAAGPEDEVRIQRGEIYGFFQLLFDEVEAVEGPEEG